MCNKILRATVMFQEVGQSTPPPHSSAARHVRFKIATAGAMTDRRQRSYNLSHASNGTDN